MPSSSLRQARFMQAIAHDPKFARKVGVPVSVGQDFAAADKGKFAGGGSVLDTRLLQPPTQSELRTQYPTLYGVLAGLMGSAPDQLSSGSVLDPDAQTNNAAVRQGAEYGFPVGTALQILPAISPIASKAISMVAEAAPGPAAGGIAAQRGAIVWHGSPRKFEKFDASKIGTGEGAQAYGHGLYLAENPAVAKDYAGALSAARANKPVGNVDLAQAYQSLPNDVPDTLLAARRDFRALNDAGELSPADRRDFLKAVKNNLTAAQNGNLYKVDLPDEHIAKMLDWDKPLSQQPHVVQAIAEHPVIGANSPAWAGAPDGMFERSFANPERNGEWLYRDLLSNDSNSANSLRDMGITGIKYLDGSSRGAGQGTRNYVIFPGNESMLNILERNGVPLPTDVQQQALDQIKPGFAGGGPVINPQVKALLTQPLPKK